MAFALIATDAAGSSDVGQTVTSAAIDTTGANLITVCVSSYQTNPAPTLTDNKSNTWTGLTVREQATAARIRIFYCFNPTVGSGHTFTATNSPTASFPTLIVHAWSGAATSPFDQENGNTSPGIGPTSSGSVTPTENNELIITAVSQGGASVTNQTSIDGGFTMSGNVSRLAGNHQAGAAAYLIQTTAAAANPAWTHGGSGATAVAIATFKAAADVAIPPTVSAPQPAPRWSAPMAVLTIAASLLTSTLAPAQPLPPYRTRWTDMPLRARPTIYGTVDGGRIPPLISIKPPPLPSTALPLRARPTIYGYIHPSRAIYEPLVGLPPGKASTTLPLRGVGGRLLITINSEPVEVDQDPPVRPWDWTAPRGKDPYSALRAFTQRGQLAAPGDPLVQTVYALPVRAIRTPRTETLNTIPLLISVKPIGRDATTLPAPRRLVLLTTLTWVQSPAVPPVVPPVGRGATILPDRRKVPVRDWILPTPLVLAVTPPPPDFNHLCVHVVGTWPRVYATLLVTPEVTVAGTWPRVLTVTLLGCPDD